MLWQDDIAPPNTSHLLWRYETNPRECSYMPYRFATQKPRVPGEGDSSALVPEEEGDPGCDVAKNGSLLKVGCAW